MQSRQHQSDPPKLAGSRVLVDGAGLHGKHFLAVRSDGLGARLLAILNVAVLAKHFGVAFRIVWNPKSEETHAIAPADQTFDSDFIRVHHVEAYRSSDYSELKNTGHSVEQVREWLCTSASGVIVHHQSLTSLVRPLPWSDLDDRYAEAFQAICFAGPVREVIAAANAIVLPSNPVAVHLRAGDIVYGKFRFMKRFNQKVLPYPVAKRLIAELLAAGKYPLIFGQDMATCRLLATKFQLKLASDFLGLGEGASNVQVALAEVSLMSRCEAILSGSSAFPILAGLVGKRPLTEPRNLWGNKEFVQTIVEDDELSDDSSELPSLQRSFSCYSAVHSGQRLLSLEQRLGLMEQAIRHDPGNVFYWLLRAQLQVSEGSADDAEEGLRRLMVHAIERDRPLNKSTLFRILSGRSGPGGVPYMNEYVDQISRVAGTKYPGASFVAALSAVINRNRQAAASYAANCVPLGDHALSLGMLIRAADEK